MNNAHNPRENSCNNLDYSSNAPVLAEYKDYHGWKNGRNGVIFNEVGRVHFTGMKVADN